MIKNKPYFVRSLFQIELHLLPFRHGHVCLFFKTGILLIAVP